MKILFLDTSSFFVTISIINNNEVVYNFQEEIRDDMSSKILPIIREGFNTLDFELKDIDKIMVVNGPGSFTGVRIGVTIAKVMAYSLKKDIITISSLEYLATTECNTEYIIPMIDARRGYYFAGVYDTNLNNIYKDNYIQLADITEYLNKGTIVSLNDIEGSIKPKLDVLKIVNKHIGDRSHNPHMVKPNYLKKTEAEEKLMEK